MPAFRTFSAVNRAAWLVVAGGPSAAALALAGSLAWADAGGVAATSAPAASGPAAATTPARAAGVTSPPTAPPTPQQRSAPNSQTGTRYEALTPEQKQALKRHKPASAP
jgi:type IV secretory pathway VirB10-like protein